MKKTLLRLLVAGVVLFILIQFIPTGSGLTNPPVTKEPNWDSPQTRAMVQNSCFDCHSNETVFPWYSKVAPVKWLLAFDTIEGRGKLNFSEWDRRHQESLGEMIEVIQSGEMPPAKYTLMHPNAILTADQKAQLIEGLKNTLGQ